MRIAKCRSHGTWLAQAAPHPSLCETPLARYALKRILICMVYACRLIGPSKSRRASGWLTTFVASAHDEICPQASESFGLTGSRSWDRYCGGGPVSNIRVPRCSFGFSGEGVQTPLAEAGPKAIAENQDVRPHPDPQEGSK